jgi:hypothetical protein
MKGKERRQHAVHNIVLALNSGIPWAQEVAAGEADARGWNPDAVDGMMQEVEESTADLLPVAEQMLQDLAEEARASWEERAVYKATRITNLAAEAFETLDVDIMVQEGLHRRRLYMTYTLSMVQKKIISRLIRPKLSNVVISKQA